jgi:hypothetical protein
VTNDKLKVRRVVAALDVAAMPVQVLDTAAVLATALHAELVGLYVEDERLLRAAELPFAQEFGLATAHARQIGVVDVERALRGQAERLRRMVGALAGPRGLAWSLDVVRGDALRSAVAYAGADDLLVIGRARCVPGEFGRASPAAPGGGARLRPVAVLFDATVQAVRALGLAATLARAARCEVAVLIPAASPESFRALRVDAERVLEGLGSSVATYVMLPDQSAVCVERATRGLRAGVLVCPAGERGAAGRTVARLLANVTCPIVMAS